LPRKLRDAVKEREPPRNNSQELSSDVGKTIHKSDNEEKQGKKGEQLRKTEGSSEGKEGIK